jgi:hypothetical protein
MPALFLALISFLLLAHHLGATARVLGASEFTASRVARACPLEPAAPSSPSPAWSRGLRGNVVQRLPWLVVVGEDVVMDAPTGADL